MARAKAMTYEELMAYALKNYDKGGDSTYECWDEKAFNEYVGMFGPMTKSKALQMFRRDLSMRQDMMGW